MMVAARMPRITTTTMISIRVNARWPPVRDSVFMRLCPINWKLLLRKWVWRKRSPSPPGSAGAPGGEGRSAHSSGEHSRPLVWHCFMGTLMDGAAHLEDGQQQRDHHETHNGAHDQDQRRPQ